MLNITFKCFFKHPKLNRIKTKLFPTGYLLTNTLTWHSVSYIFTVENSVVLNGFPCIWLNFNCYQACYFFLNITYIKTPQCESLLVCQYIPTRCKFIQFFQGWFTLFWIRIVGTKCFCFVLKHGETLFLRL